MRGPGLINPTICDPDKSMGRVIVFIHKVYNSITYFNHAFVHTCRHSFNCFLFVTLCFELKLKTQIH